MKKLIALVLTVILALPVAGLASVLTETWQDAPLADLQDAQLKITERITQLQAADAPASEVIVLTGSGTDIKTGIKVDFAPSLPSELRRPRQPKSNMAESHDEYIARQWWIFTANCAIEPEGF